MRFKVSRQVVFTLPPNASPISGRLWLVSSLASAMATCRGRATERLRRLDRWEEHTSELQSPCNLVCRLLLEKKKTTISEVTPICSYNVTCYGTLPALTILLNTR